jgi:hypothetical protein
MKKLQILLLISLITFTAQAQQFGIHAGIHLGNAASEDIDAPGIDKPAKVGPIAGIVADFKISENFHFRPELNYIQKGFKRTYTEPGFGSATISAKFNYIEVPLNFAYGIPAGKNKVLVGAGPSIGYGLSGTVKSRYEAEGEPVEEEESDVNFGSNEDEDDLKPLDLGFNLFAAYQMTQGFFLKAGYTFGLSNISHDSEADFKNKGFSITVGYMFKKKK